MAKNQKSGLKKKIGDKLGEMLVKIGQRLRQNFGENWWKINQSVQLTIPILSSQFDRQIWWDSIQNWG